MLTQPQSKEMQSVEGLLSFKRLKSGKFPCYVRFKTRPTWIQNTRLPASYTAG